MTFGWGAVKRNFKVAIPLTSVCASGYQPGKEFSLGRNFMSSREKLKKKIKVVSH